MLLVTAMMLCVAPQEPRDLEALLRSDERCAAIVERARDHRLQVLLAEPVVHDDGRVTLRRSHLGDAERYWYPASSIKLCGAVAVLIELQAHNREHGTALGLDSPLVIEPRFDGDARVAEDASNVDGGLLTVRHALRKMLIVSDNQAYNHCFEVCGQDGINRAMWHAGLSSVRLWHRLSESRTLDENRVTRAVRIGDARLAARDAGVDLDNSHLLERRIGDAYMNGGERVDGAMSFDHKNAITLQDLQDLLVEVVRPEIDSGKRGFPELSVANRAFLVNTLGSFPRESQNPVYDGVADHELKSTLRGMRRVVPAASLRIYNKTGRAYGFSIENAYVEDERTGRGFFLSVVLHTNPNGVLNDDDYSYDELAVPFLDAVGEVVARAVFGGGDRK